MTTPIDSIREYCEKYGMRKTADLLPSKSSTSNVELEQIFFETETKKADVLKSLGIVFKGNAERDELRKRIRNMDESHVKKSKPKKERKEKRQDEEEQDKIPEGFLTLLDELALDRKDAEVLYKNKDQWKFVKSDRKIFCTEQGTELNHFFNGRGRNDSKNRLTVYILHQEFHANLSIRFGRCPDSTILALFTEKLFPHRIFNFNFYY